MPNLQLQHKALFRVSAGPFDSIAFMKCSAIRVEAETVTHRAGGTLLANKMPGLVSVPPVTLDRGMVAQDNRLYRWFKRLTNVASINIERN
ncbi:MAG TPA: phage tail protein, partial [Planctomycetota bacterium]|nr:phage tail protein [Planctomycetota bacterium]